MMTLFAAVRRSLSATLEMALPTTCGGCGAPGVTWCQRCAHEAGQATYQGSPRRVCPTPCPVGFPPTWAASPYDGAVRAALAAFKDGDRRDLERVLAPMLSDAVAAALAMDARLRGVLASGNGPVFVVPVPSSPSAVRRRGDAPLELLTRAAVAQTARCERELLVSPALTLRRRVADQAGLDHRQRATNLEYAMRVHPRWRASIRGVTCLLVDDVLTTGATLVEAARALRAGGADHVGAAAVAATQRRGVPVRGGVHDGDPWVASLRHPGPDRSLFELDVPRHLLVDYRSCMNPKVAVSTAESGVGAVGRWAPVGILGCNLRWGWCGG